MDERLANLSIYKPEPMVLREKPTTPNSWFGQHYPEQAEKCGSPFLELNDGGHIICASINIDFFAACLGGRKALKHHAVYFTPEVEFYYRDSDGIYRPTTPEKMANLYRALLLKCAEQMPGNVNLLNLFHEFRSDRIAKSVVQRAKSILAAGPEFFSPTSPNQRIRGAELLERVARVFVEDLLAKEPGTILKLQDAYSIFRGLLRQRNLPDIKRSDFKAVVGPLITAEFDVCLRKDLSVGQETNLRGWKNVKLIQAGKN